MPVGILTIHSTTNYGATSQAYALWKRINDLGYDVELINYRPIAADRYYERQCFPLSKSRWIKPDWHERLGQLLKNRSFIASNTRLTERVTTAADLQKLQHRYDTVIVGSDEVWHLEKPFRPVDGTYFLNFVRNARKVSYATSFGDTVSFEHQSSFIGPLLEQFDSLSVRDTRSAEIVNAITDETPEVVLDPSLLVDLGSNKTHPQVVQPFMFCYLDTKLAAGEQSFLKRAAAQQGLRIVCQGAHLQIDSQQLVAPSVLEWWNCFQKADMVATNCFHGVLFAMRFKKPTVFFMRQAKQNKTGDFLKRVNGEPLIFDELKTFEDSMRAILEYDFAKFEKVMNEWRLSSDGFLREALSNAAR